MKRWSILLLMCLLAHLAAVVPSQAALPHCTFKTFSTADGLIHNRISDIYTDSEGFVWICTWYGVSRFDGYAFKNYATVPGDFSPLSHNRFVSVSEDRCGHLWFTTYNNRLYRFNRHTERFEDPLPLLEGVDTVRGRVTRTLHDAEGGTWITLAGAGMARLEGRPDSSPLRVTCRIGDLAGETEVTRLHLGDDSCTLWAATKRGVLCRIAPSGEVRTVADLGEPVVQIVSMRRRVYVLTRSAVYRCDEEGTAAPVRLQGEGEWTACAVDVVHGLLYAGTKEGGLFRAESAADRLTPVAATRSRVRSLETDSQGVVWIVTPEAGITRYHPGKNNLKHFEQAPYTVSYNIDTLPKIAESEGRVWIKLNKYGFGYYDRATDRMESFYNNPSEPDCLMTNAVVRFDVQGDVLWLTTYFERGLRRALLTGQPAETLHPATRFADELSGEVRAMMTDRSGKVWLGIKSGELLCYSADRKLLHRFPQTLPTLGPIYALREDSRGNIWIGTRGEGLYCLEPAGESYRMAAHYKNDREDPFSLSNDHIYSIEEDALGRIWIATYGGGVNLLDPADGRFIHSGNHLAYPTEEGRRVRWLLDDGQGRMLAGTVDGLVVFEPLREAERIRFRLVQKIPGDTTSLGGNDVMHMIRDSRNRVWLAVYGGGLNRIERYDADGTPRFRCFDRNDGLSSNICISVVEDRLGQIWTATLDAVLRFDEERGLFTEYLSYEDQTNPVFNETGAMAGPAGRVCFGAGNCVLACIPGSSPAADTDFRLRFTDFWVRNRPAEIGPDAPLSRSVTCVDRIELPHDYANFRISFAALNFALQEQVDYMYKLEGYDRDWNMSGKLNRASYSNVPPGRYTFRVKAYTGRMAAGDDDLLLPIVIRYPLWLTWWAKLLYVTLLCGAVLLVWRITASMRRVRLEARMEQEMADMKLGFFTNISHELRTPLTLILGGIEDVRKHDSLSQHGAISLSLAHRNARRMLTLINQLLDFRKIVKDKMELQISHVNLVPLVEEAIDDFREMAAERHIELLFTVSHRSILVWIDPERMESVVYNLLSNAFKFTRNNGRIEVILTVSEAEGMVSMTVRDNGVGIARDQQKAIFERFHQASRPVEGNLKGSGIGLSLCRDIVALHHGEISVESRPNEGSAFTVRLRLGNAHFGMEQGGPGEGADGVRKDAEGHRLNCMVSDYVPAEGDRRTDVAPPKDAQRILLVEDNRELRAFIYNSLIENYRVIEAEDGVEALEAIRREMPDMIVTDLMMPNMDGIELIDRVRHDFSSSHLPIIMLTAKHSLDERIKAVEYGADAYITKPFSIDLLLANIDHLLVQRRALFENFSAQSGRSRITELSPKEVVVTDRDEAFLKDVMEWIGENIENSELAIEQLANHLGLGRTTMYNKLKSLTGKSPVELIKEYRINKSRLLLQTGQFSVSEVAYKVGFSDPGYFSRCFRDQFGMSPAEFLKTNNLKQTNKKTTK